MEEIDPEKGTGRVKLGDVDWGARSDNGQIITVGTPVVIVERGSAVLKVRVK